MRSCVLFLLAASAFAFACGTGGPSSNKIGPDNTGSVGGGAGDGTSKAGSRLQPMSFSNSDGSQAFFGWMDTKLSRDCTFDLIYGYKGACVPSDVYTVPNNVFTDSHSNSNPTFYLDNTCTETKGVVIPAGASCLDYGIIKVTGGNAASSSYPGCGGYAGAQYYVLKPFDLAKQKAYAYGVPPGPVGQCCSCYEIKTPPAQGTMFLYEPPSEENLSNITLVTGDLNLPK